MYNESGTGKNGNNGFIRMKTIAEGQIFSDFNAYDYIYVDKTDYIFNILRLYFQHLKKSQKNLHLPSKKIR